MEAELSHLLRIAVEAWRAVGQMDIPTGESRAAIRRWLTKEYDWIKDDVLDNIADIANWD